MKTGCLKSPIRLAAGGSGSFNRGQWLSCNHLEILLARTRPPFPVSLLSERTTPAWPDLRWSCEDGPPGQGVMLEGLQVERRADPVATAVDSTWKSTVTEKTW